MGVRSGLFSINLVSIGLGLLLVAAIYAGWKFAPVYYQAQEVDTILGSGKAEAAKINMFAGDPRKAKLEQRLYDECVGLGIDDRYLSVYFADDFGSLHADYTVFVEHPFGFETTLEFERSTKIPRADLGN